MRRHYLRSVVIAIAVCWSARSRSCLGSRSAPARTRRRGRRRRRRRRLANVDNVILFIGDGMGPNHVQVGRQLNGGTL